MIILVWYICKVVVLSLLPLFALCMQYAIFPRITMQFLLISSTPFCLSVIRLHPVTHTRTDGSRIILPLIAILQPHIRQTFWLRVKTFEVSCVPDLTTGVVRSISTIYRFCFIFHSVPFDHVYFCC